MSLAHSGFIAGSIETITLAPKALVPSSRLIPALLPAQLKLHGIHVMVETMRWAHSGFIAGSIETIPYNTAH